MKKLALLGIVAVTLVVCSIAFGSKLKMPSAHGGTPGAVPLPPRWFPPVTPIAAAEDGTVRFTSELSNSNVLRNSDGEVYLQLLLDAVRPEPSSDGSANRLPLNLALVIDKSGSMGSERKLDYVKDAALFLVGQLDEGDTISIVTYDDNVYTILPATHAGDGDLLRRLIQGITSGGSTNLSGGMVAGEAEVRKYFEAERVNRVLLLSDGLANRGITSPEALNRLAQQSGHSGISVTTMGVGVQYNEDLMLDLAEYSGGNYYYISSAENLASIFSQELRELMRVVAKRATVTLELADGVTFRDAVGYKHSLHGNRVEIPVGDVYGGQRRKIMVRLAVPTSDVGEVPIADVALRYDDMLHGAARVNKMIAMATQCTEDIVAVEKGRDLKVLEMADSVNGATVLKRAMGLFATGRRAEAQKVLKTEADALDRANSTLYNSSALNSQIEKMKEYSRQMENEEMPAREAKDLIKQGKFDAYQQVK